MTFDPHRWLQLNAFPLVLVALLVLSVGQAWAADCGADTPCEVEGGLYLVSAPEGWDGESPIPATLHFHGWGNSAFGVLNNTSLVEQYSDLGVLLVVPQGVKPPNGNRTWAHQGSPGEDLRDGTAFLNAVLDDVLARFPIDESRVRATGFSQGGSMAWHAACFAGDRFQAFMPIAGAFWRPHPESCPSGPANVLHVHGWSDGVVPLEGRRIPERADHRWHQGDVWEGLRFWRRHNQAFHKATDVTLDGDVWCKSWASDVTDTEIRFCLHDGGHEFPRGWTARAHAWADTLPPRTERAAQK